MLGTLLETVRDWVDSRLEEYTKNSEFTTSLQRITKLNTKRLLVFDNINDLKKYIQYIPIETTIYLKNYKTYYTLVSNSNKYLTENSGFLIEDTDFGLIINTSKSNPMFIGAFGALPNVNSRENSDLIVKTIKLAMSNGIVIKVPSNMGKWYIKSPIEITGSLNLQGETNLGANGLTYGGGSCIVFDPEASGTKNENVTLFTDKGSHKVTIKNMSLFCPYGSFKVNTTKFRQVNQTPFEYFTWTYQYDWVSCLNLPTSISLLEDINITGFSGFGLCCDNANQVRAIRTCFCKYGFYNCRTDTMFYDCFIQGCEHGMHWEEYTKADGNKIVGTILLCYDLWADQCKYAIYSEGCLCGRITGEIDHCMYAGIYGIDARSGLTIEARYGRHGMYYAGTDMLTLIPEEYSDESFNELSKGAFIAIKYGRGIKIDTDTLVRGMSDDGTKTDKTPTLFAVGKEWTDSIIDIPDLTIEKNRIYKMFDDKTSNILLPNHALNSFEETPIDFTNWED